MAITVVPVAIDTLASANGVWDVWFGLCWAAWAVLWFMFFLLLAMGKPIAKVTGMVTSIQGVLTGWLPGYLLLDGVMGPAAEAAAAPAEAPADSGFLLDGSFNVAELWELVRVVGLS